jgi:hypothetical protein
VLLLPFLLLPPVLGPREHVADRSAAVGVVELEIRGERCVYFE